MIWMTSKNFKNIDTSRKSRESIRELWLLNLQLFFKTHVFFVPHFAGRPPHFASNQGCWLRLCPQSIRPPLASPSAAGLEVDNEDLLLGCITLPETDIIKKLKIGLHRRKCNLSTIYLQGLCQFDGGQFIISSGPLVAVYPKMDMHHFSANELFFVR